MDIYRSKREGAGGKDSSDPGEILAKIAAKRAGKKDGSALQARSAANPPARTPTLSAAPKNEDTVSSSVDFQTASESDGFHSAADDLSPARRSDDDEVTSGPACGDAKPQRLNTSSDGNDANNKTQSTTLTRPQEEHPNEESLINQLKGLSVNSSTIPCVSSQHPSVSGNKRVAANDSKASSSESAGSTHELRPCAEAAEEDAKSEVSGSSESSISVSVPARPEETNAASARVTPDRAEQDEAGEDWDVGDGLIVSGAIASGLYPHQREGIQWLWKLHQQGRGGILGDDMGLGKTRQIATFLAALLECGIIKRALLVIPTTLLPQWHLEFKSVGISRCREFGSNISVMKRDAFLYDYSAEGGILLTTYEMVKQVKGHTSFDYMVLDEGHLAKNASTQRFQVLKSLDYRHCILLTGTPIQNQLKELWSLYDLCGGGLLGSYKEFKDMYEKKIVAGNEKDASRRLKALANDASKALRVKIQPYILRRMKREIFPSSRDHLNQPRVHVPGQPPPLPVKTDLVVWLTLTARQRTFYEAFLQSPAVRNALVESKNCLAALTILKKICDHPKLLTEGAIDGIKDGLELEASQAMNKDSFKEVLAFCKKMQDDPRVLEDPKASCKLRFLGNLVANLVADGHHVLVFSQTKIMLDMAEVILKHQGIPFLRIDGEVKPDARERRVQQFQAGAGPVFLLTSKVGGVGLTLHQADRVIVLDPSWNPSTDNQSVDRAYRIGQRRDVVVYRLITCATIEEKIYGLQVMKDGLVRSATANQDSQLRYFNESEVRDALVMPSQGFDKCLAFERLEGLHKDEIVLDAEVERHISEIKGWKNVIGVSHHDLLYNKEDSSFFSADVPTDPPQQEPLIRLGRPADTRRPFGSANGHQFPVNSSARPGGILAAAKSAMPVAAPAPTLYDIKRAKEESNAAQAQVKHLEEQIKGRKLTLSQKNLSEEAAEKTRVKLRELESEKAKAVTHAAVMSRRYDQIAPVNLD